MKKLIIGMKFMIFAFSAQAGVDCTISASIDGTYTMLKVDKISGKDDTKFSAMISGNEKTYNIVINEKNSDVMVAAFDNGIAAFTLDSSLNSKGEFELDLKSNGDTTEKITCSKY